MTSGQHSSLSLSSIYVDREARQRKLVSPESVAALASSISKIGLIHAIVVERDGKLRVGETRLEACKSLGWTHIPVQFVDEMDEATFQLMELDENLKRTEISWQDQCDAIARYHRLKEKIEPTWSVAATGTALGLSYSTISQAIAVQTALENPEHRVHKATKLSEARNIVFRANERAAASQIEKIEGKVSSTEVPLLNEDFNEWAPKYSGPKFNFLHCDFPYGVNADNQQQGANVAAFGGYADGTEVYEKLLETLARSMENVVDPSAHLIFWYSMHRHQFTFDTLTEMGWAVNPFPLIWHKSDNAGLLPDYNRGPRRTYESAFFASRGDRKIVSPVANSISAPTTKRIHMSEKPDAVLKHFFRMTTDEHTRLLDPTAGSAGALRCATSIGADRVLGLEKSPEFYTLAKERYFDDN